MALFKLQFESQYLGIGQEVDVIMPDRNRSVSAKEFYSENRKFPVLWLLHGTYGDQTDWIRKSNIELYACERELITVMPSACNSGYDDWPNFATGYYWQEFLFEELMPMIYHWLPASEARDDNYIAGLSMGGRGALKMMLAHPEKFKAGAMLSSFPMKFEDDCILQKVAAMSDAEKACLKQKLMQPVDGMSEEFRMGRCLNYLEMFGSYEAYYNSQENTWRSLKESVIKQDLPAMYFACGTEDFMYDRYHSFQEYAAKIGLHAVFEEGPGRHEWRFWKKYIQNALEFFNIGAEKQGNIY